MNDQNQSKLIINNQAIEQPNRTSTLEIHSVFNTIQGEARFAGVPATFIRLAGCNLRCAFCDTEYTQGRTVSLNAKSALSYVQSQVVLKPLIVITGGEPFRQWGLYPFMALLVEAGYTVQVETNGTIFSYSLWESNKLSLYNPYIVCSPKTARVHIDIQPLITDWKYVIEADKVCAEDGLPLSSVGPQYGIPARPQKLSLLYEAQDVDHPVRVWVQPLDSQDEFRNAQNTQACVKSCMTFGYRLCIQTHKIAGLA